LGVGQLPQRDARFNRHQELLRRPTDDLRRMGVPRRSADSRWKGVSVMSGVQVQHSQHPRASPERRAKQEAASPPRMPVKMLEGHLLVSAYTPISRKIKERSPNRRSIFTDIKTSHIMLTIFLFLKSGRPGFSKFGLGAIKRGHD
jgi:hypothetical protein